MNATQCERFLAEYGQFRIDYIAAMRIVQNGDLSNVPEYTADPTSISRYGEIQMSIANAPSGR